MKVKKMSMKTMKAMMVRAMGGMGMLFALVAAPLVQGAVTVYPESGSLFASAVLASATATNTFGTNCFTLNAGTSTAAYSTNLAATVTRAIDISGASSFQVWTRCLQSNAGGATNNGAITLTFHTSPDGVLYGSAFTVSVPSVGTTAATQTAVITEDAKGSPAYIKLYSISHTNIGATWISNCVYRVIKTKTQ